MISLEETKAFLRIDSSHEDALITSFITSAEELKGRVDVQNLHRRLELLNTTKKWR
ncbi:MAG TPA: head-tail connector protein [Pseudobacteroides sp.]|uniref:head-tail connector protein n=1 Tax=Pseudobacteroides sp. TaxID=1968840 RepID=UPI002F94C6E7